MVATTIPCYMTKKEKEAVQIAAKRLGFQNMAALVRFCIFERYQDEIDAAHNFLSSGEQGRTDTIVNVQG